MLVFSQLVRGIAPATILDCWLLGSNMAGRGRWLFYFSSICGWGSRASPWARSGCWLSGLHLWPCIRIFLLFSVTACCLPPVPLLFLWKHGGDWGSGGCSANTPHFPLRDRASLLWARGKPEKGSRAAGKDLSQLVSCPSEQTQAASFSLMPRHLLSSSPWEGRKDNPSSIFTREKWELLTAAPRESVWIYIGMIEVGL